MGADHDDKPRALLTVRIAAHASVRAWAARYSVTVADVVDVMVDEFESREFTADQLEAFRQARNRMKAKRVSRARKAAVSKRTDIKPRRSGGAN